MSKLRSLWYVHFVLTILFVITLTSDMAVLYGNNALMILVLPTKKRYSSFFGIGFRFPENLFQSYSIENI